MTQIMLQRKPMDMSLTDPKIYRDAMARYAGHVQLVTTAHGGMRRGVAVTAACSVSDHPPTVLVCLNHGNEKNRLFFDSGIFALNSLGAHHQALSHGFSGLENLSMDDRFARGQWDEMVTGAPTLIDALAVYDCRIIDIRPVATHSILIGEVASVRLGEKNPALIYMDRHYQTL
jgi:cob(II)yrinic acid a,c-diamide reductase